MPLADSRPLQHSGRCEGDAHGARRAVSLVRLQKHDHYHRPDGNPWSVTVPIHLYPSRERYLIPLQSLRALKVVSLELGPISCMAYHQRTVWIGADKVVIGMQAITQSISAYRQVCDRLVL